MPLMRSPALSYLPKPRLNSPMPPRLPLPMGYIQDVVVSFAPGGVLNYVPGRTYCVVSDAQRSRAVVSSLESSEKPACRFSQMQLDSLSSTTGRLLLANNLASEQLSRPLEDPQGLLNLVDTEVTIDLVDSPFFRPDAVVGLVSPAALFES